jgi:HK97 family phage major capsid protein
MPNALQDARGKLLERSEKQAALFDKKDAKTGKPDWSPEDHETFQALDKEINEIAAEVRELEVLDAKEQETRSRIVDLKKPQHPTRHGSGRPSHDGAGERGEEFETRGGGARGTKSIGQMVIDSPEFKGYRRGVPMAVNFDDLDYKATMTTAAGFAPFSPRGPDVVPYPIRRVRLLDIMREVPTGAASIVYMEETTHTAGAAVVAEGATKPESAYVFTQRTVLVEVVATLLPVTDQQLDDVPQIRGLIDGMMGEDVARAEETQILTGTGVSPELQGFLTKTGVQTQAKGADSTPSAVYKAITLARYTGFAEPDGAVFHPNDWQDIRLLQDTTGRYIWGDPWVPGPEMIWGVPVVVTPAETEGTGLIGAFRQYAYVARRQGLRIEIGFVNDNFAKNLKTIKAETRIANVIRRPSAFVKITGI